MPSIGKQAKNKEFKIRLPKNQPGIGRISLINALEEHVWGWFWK